MIGAKKNGWAPLARGAFFVFIVSTVALAAEEEAIQVLPEQGRVSLAIEAGRLDIRFYEKGVVQVELLSPGQNAGPESHLTVPAALAPITLGPAAGTGEIKVPQVIVKYSLNPLQVEFSNLEGKVLLGWEGDGITRGPDGSYRMVWKKEPGDRFWGLGEPFPGRGPFGGVFSTLSLDHNGKKRPIWNRHVPPSDLGLPFFLNPNGYGLLIDNADRAVFDFTPSTSFSYSAEGGPLRFYFLAGPALYDVLDAYSQLTGRPPLPPKWVTGYMQCKYGYKDEATFRWLMDNFRSRNLPCDALIFDLDWFAYGEGQDVRMGELQWSPVHFPNPLALQRELHERGFKSIVIVEPYIWQNCSRFPEVRELNLAARNSGGHPYYFQHWSKVNALLLDFLNPETRAWFGNRIQDIHQTGVDGWWTDLNEPENDFPDMVFSGRPDHAAHNLQPLLMHQAMADMYRRDFPSQRLFIMSRGSFVGDWRYGAGVWSGDVDSSWGHLRQQIPIGIAAGLSGWGLWNSDAGGFHGRPSPELYQRWMQFAAFCPIFRAHGNHQPREPWSFGPEAERNLKKLLELRYRLSPYLYSLFHQMHESGKPIIRALFLEFPDDPQAYTINSQFMYGPWLMVAPVTTARARARSVYLPKGEWTDFWTGRVFSGPQTLRAKAPLDRIPLFVREGAILPFAPVMQYIGEKPASPLTLHLYPGPTSSVYEIYDDDGATNAYQRGEFLLTKILVSRDPELQVQLSRQGRFTGKSEEQLILVFHNQNQRPSGIFVDDESLAENNGDEPAPSGWTYSTSRKTLTIGLPSSRQSLSVKVVR